MSVTNRPTDETPLPFGVVPVVRPVRGFRPWLIGLVYFVVLLPVMVVSPLTLHPWHSANVLSRYMTIEAIVERGTLSVERTPMMRIARPVDMVRFGDHYYSDKPPVMVVLSTPIYAAMVMLGVRFTGSETQFIVDSLMLTWLVVGTTSALGLVWLRRLLQAVPISAGLADLLTLAFGFGTQFLTYSVTFNNHSVAAALITGAIARTILERPGGAGSSDRFAAGLLAGFAAVIDLPTGCLMVAGLGLIQTIRSRSIPGLFVVGLAGPLLLHCWLQSLVTGTPLPVEMYPAAFDYPGSFWLTPAAKFEEYGPRSLFAIELLLGPPGWLTLTPVLVFGLIDLVRLLARRTDPLRPLAAVVVGSLVVLVIYHAWIVRRTDFAGQSFGTRHLLAITPVVYFFAIDAFGRLRGVVGRTLFWLCVLVGIFYAYHGSKDPWARIEERELKEPTLKIAQRFVVYPWSRTRHKMALDRAQAAPPQPPANPAEARP